MRWVTIRLLLLAAAGVIVSALFALLMSWRRIPWDRLGGSIQPNDAFDLEGIVPIAYTLFALALLLALGVLLRRTIPAMAIASVAYVALRIGVQTYVRPHFVAPLATGRSGRPNPGRGAWVLSSTWMDRHGHSLTDTYVLNLCASLRSPGIAKSDFTSCLGNHGLFQAATFQPADRFWTLQISESALFLGLTAVLAGITLWWVRSRMM